MESFSFIKYEGYTYIDKKHNKDSIYDGVALITTRTGHSYSPQFIDVKWFKNPNFIVQFQYLIYNVGDVDYPILTPNAICVKEEKTIKSYGTPFYDNVLYTNCELEELTLSNNKIINTPWFISNCKTYPKRLVWVFNNGKINIGCISCEDPTQIKLSKSVLDNIYKSELCAFETNNCCEMQHCCETQHCCKTMIDLSYLKQNGPKTVNIILDYLTDRSILLHLPLSCLRSFMDEKHFNIWQCSEVDITGAVSSLIIVNAVKNWIDLRYDDAILNLLPILIKYGYINDIAKAICDITDVDDLNIKLGKYMTFNKNNILEKYKLFNKYVECNPIQYKIKKGDIKGAASYINYHQLFSNHCFRRLIETKSQGIIEWVIDCGKYDQLLSSFNIEYMIHSITVPSIIKKYLEKIKVQELHEKQSINIIKHLMKFCANEEIFDISSKITNLNEQQLSLLINSKLEDVLFEVALGQFQISFSPYVNKSSMHDRIVIFDRIMKEFKVNPSVLYRIENKIAKGICPRLILFIDTCEIILTHIVKFYNITDVMNILTMNHDYYYAINADRITKWLAKLKL